MSGDIRMPRRFEFDWDTKYQKAARLFGVKPKNAWVEVNHWDLRVRFGPWALRSPLSNITGVDVTEDYAFVKTAGPAHLSAADRGITFASNGRRGLCVGFENPVPGIDPLDVIKHPGATITVADIDGLAAALGFDLATSRR